MARNGFAVFVVAAGIAAGCGSPAEVADPVVARVGKEEIRYQQIRCDSARQKPDHGDADPRCRHNEQARLDSLLRKRLFEHAARVHGIVIRDDEVLAAMPRGAMPSDEVFLKSETHMRAVARAYLRIDNGDDPDEVYRRDLAPLGISREFFESTTRRWSRAGAEATMKKDLASEFRRQILDQHRERLLRRRIQEVAYQLQRERALTPEAAWREVWQDVIEKSGMKVVDGRYQLPDIDGL